MKWIISLLKMLAGKVRIIPDRLDTSLTYLNRWYLIGGPNHRVATLCLHEILMSDPADRHNHPWPYFTLILGGGYWETTPKGRFWRGPGYFTFRSASSFHRLELKDGKPCTTLFFMGPRVGEWGFDTPNGWIDHDTYLGRKKVQ